MSWVATCLMMLGLCIYAIYTGRVTWILTGIVTAYTCWSAGLVVAQLLKIDQELRACDRDYAKAIETGGASVLRNISGRPSLLCQFVATSARLAPEDLAALLDGYAADLDASIDQGRSAAARLPSLGLIGTVIGIIIMVAGFQLALDSQDGQVTHGLTQSLTGMSAAFYTTAAGSAGFFLVEGLAKIAERAGDRLIAQVGTLGRLLTDKTGGQG